MDAKIMRFIEESSLPKEHKLTIKFLVESIEKKDIGEFNDKSFLIEGDPGIGKTYFIENLIKQINLPILFLGPFKFEHDNVKQFQDLKGLMNELLKTKECIVFIDDLQNSLKMEKDGVGLRDDERKRFLGLLEHIKRSKQRKFLFANINDKFLFEEAWLDRFETRIKLDAPKEKSKKIFLINKYPQYLKKSIINEIAEKSIGYNFRNLDGLIKVAFREGNGIINKKSIEKAFSSYTPTSMENYNVIHKTNIKFRDVVGNEKLKQQLSFLKKYLKYPKIFKKCGIERSNVMIFAGPPGTGKTFMAKSLAGELNIPIIDIDARRMHNRDKFGVPDVIGLARRFRNCIIFIDEFDKLIGHEILFEDTEIIGTFEAQLDGINEKTKSIVIITMNNKLRFGNAFYDRIPCFDFNYPSELERRDFIINKINKSKIEFPQERIDFFVRETENRSYRQIDRIWNNILFKIIENEKTLIKNNKIETEDLIIDESIKEVLGFVSNARPVSSMFG